jgi:hypothetical protein
MNEKETQILIVHLVFSAAKRHHARQSTAGNPCHTADQQHLSANLPHCGLWSACEKSGNNSENFEHRFQSAQQKPLIAFRVADICGSLLAVGEGNEEKLPPYDFKEKNHLGARFGVSSFATMPSYS